MSVNNCLLLRNVSATCFCLWRPSLTTFTYNTSLCIYDLPESGRHIRERVAEVLIKSKKLFINVLMTNEMHNSYNQFLFHSFLSAVHVSNESSRSSSGARHNILYYTVWYNRYNRACTIVPIVHVSNESSSSSSGARHNILHYTVQSVQSCCNNTNNNNNWL